MNIIIGLGNPGEKYQHTRHNVGWLFLDFLVKKLELPEFSDQKKVFSKVSKNSDFLLVKPQTFMNDSGRAVQAVLKWNGVDLNNPTTQQLNNLIVVYDDLDIELGKFKVQFGSGPKIHNGVNSVREHLHNAEFWNVRIGTDGRGGDRTQSGREYVLQPFSGDERKELEGVFEEIVKELVVH